jgi:myo-inositol 2-dehydrogenase / D-chiro-inositol 1-dehydrogenase
MQTYRIAFLGAGRIGQMHLANLRTIAGVQVVTVVDANPAAAAAGSAIVGATPGTDPYAAIARADVDVVMIATPTGTHPELIMAAVRAGKPVWCEKPVALELADALAVKQTIDTHQVPVMFGYMRRFDSEYAAAKQAIARGEIGQIERLRAVSIDAIPPSLEFIKTSGGICIDMLIHDFDMALHLVGPIVEVQSWGSVLVDPGFVAAGDVDTVMVMVRFASGALGVIEGGRRTTWGYDIRTELSGSTGRIFVPQAAPDDRMIGTPAEGFMRRFGAAYVAELQYFFDCLRTHTAPEPGITHAIESLRVAHAAGQSLRSGRPVRM